MGKAHPLSRRRFLKRSFAFSAASLLSGCGSGIRYSGAFSDAVTGGVSHILMVGDWGWGEDQVAQDAVALAMQKYVADHNFSADALWMLGDNFYGDLDGGAGSPRWQTQFEQTYPASVFDCPAYAVPGNHDYQMAPVSKFEAELAYAAHGTSRWTMPAPYYRFMFPVVDPTITFLALDSNMPNEPAQPFPPSAAYYTQSDEQRLIQLQWLTAQLQQPLTTPFLVVVGHHPLYSNGIHGDNQTLIRDWDSLFRKAGVHLYMAGHDHDLQHLEFAGHPTSFFLSGGGGAALEPLDENKVLVRGPYGRQAHGFSHLQVRPDVMILRHLDVDGNLLHKFTKTPDGLVSILK